MAVAVAVDGKDGKPGAMGPTQTLIDYVTASSRGIAVDGVDLSPAGCQKTVLGYMDGYRTGWTVPFGISHVST